MSKKGNGRGEKKEGGENGGGGEGAYLCLLCEVDFIFVLPTPPFISPSHE
jgi:hypothetical protein